MVAATMTKEERVLAAIRGEEVDRVPFSVWGHHPPGDRTPRGQADIHLRLHAQHDLDFMKLMFHNMSLLTDFGCEFGENWDETLGFYAHTRYPIATEQDWHRLPVLTSTSPAVAGELETLRLVKHGLRDTALVLITVLSPLMVARLLAGVPQLAAYMEQAPKSLLEGLEAITTSTLTFVQAALDQGADGIFYAMEYASADLITNDQFDQLAAPVDLRVLWAARPASQLTMLHLHGSNLMFDKVKDWPADALNWDDRATLPTLAQALASDGRCVVGGLDQKRTLVSGSEAEAVAEVHDAIAQTNGRRLMIAPGCSLPLNVRDRNIGAARRAALQPLHTARKGASR